MSSAQDGERIDRFLSVMDKVEELCDVMIKHFTPEPPLTYIYMWNCPSCKETFQSNEGHVCKP